MTELDPFLVDSATVAVYGAIAYDSSQSRLPDFRRRVLDAGRRLRGEAECNGHRSARIAAQVASGHRRLLRTPRPGLPRPPPRPAPPWSHCRPCSMLSACVVNPCSGLAPVRQTSKMRGSSPRRMVTDGANDAATTTQEGVHARLQGGGGGTVPEGESINPRGGTGSGPDRDGRPALGNAG